MSPPIALAQDFGRIPLVVIVGPTAVGKTGLAVRIAQEVGGEIVSADSRQVFRGMDVGTAKPTGVERAAAAHHLIDIVDPDEHFDAGEFRRLAEETIRRRWGAGVPSLLVGGSGLYVRALLHGLAEIPRPDPGLRERLREEAERLGPAALHARLAQTDPQAASRIHPNDTYRVTRALEIVESTGKPASIAWERHAFRAGPFDCLRIGLDLPDEVLKARIRSRAGAMWGGGLVEETRDLLEKGYLPSLPSLRSVGYAETVAFLQGATSAEVALETIVRRTGQYARRQRVWFRTDRSIEWSSPSRDGDAIVEKARAFLARR